MVLDTSIQTPTALGIAALISAIGGAVSMVMGARLEHTRARDQAEEAYRDRLRDARAEAEALAQELHDLKMKEAGADEG